MSSERIYIFTGQDYLFNVMKYNLAKRGFIIERGTTAEDIETKVESFKPHLVITDGGPSVCQAIVEKGMAPRPKFIVISSTAQYDQDLSGIVDSVLIKPFTLEELIEKIDGVITGESQNLTVFRQGAVIIMTLKGNLEHQFSTRFRQALSTICSIGSIHLIIDFTAADFLAHQNLVPLLTANSRLEQQGGKISVVGLAPGLQDLFTKAGLANTFKFHKDRAEAMRS